MTSSLPRVAMGIFAASLSVGSAAASATTLDLGSAAGIHWTVTNGSTMQAVTATIPGQIHTDLHAAGVIDEPYNA